MAPDGESWIGDEPRLLATARQVSRRALRRPFRVLALAVLMTAAVVGNRVRRPPRYEATLYFRLQEGDIGGGGIDVEPRPPREVRRYIVSVVMSNQVLGEIMKHNGLVTRLFRNDPVAGIAAFRDDIDVDVNRNYFLYDRYWGEEPRSAEIAIAYTHTDRTIAQNVVHELGDTILKEQAARRAMHLEQARALNSAAVKQKRDQIRRIQADLDAFMVETGVEDRQGIAVQAQTAALHARLRAALSELQQLERRQAGLEFATSLDESKLGLFFELVDQEVNIFAPRLTRYQLVRLIVVLFPVMVVLALGLVGGFDRRIYSPGDLTARELPVFGALERFPGDDVGSYHSRTRRSRRSRV